MILDKPPPKAPLTKPMPSSATGLAPPAADYVTPIGDEVIGVDFSSKSHACWPTTNINTISSL